MTPVVAALLSGGLIVAGKWAKGKAPNVDNAIGVAGIAIILAFIETMNENLARGFSWLIVVSIAIVYFPAIAKAVT